MIPLKASWSFDVPEAIQFPGAHGEEVVRDVLLDSQVSNSRGGCSDGGLDELT